MEFPGPDGFLLSPDDPLHAEHLKLNDFLLSEEQRSEGNAAFDAKPWKKMPKRQVVRLTEAVLGRMRWLDEHDAELVNAHLARLRLATLLRVLYTIKSPYTDGELVALLGLTRPLLGRIAPYGPVDRVLEYVKSNDLTPELCRALREFQGDLREQMSESQASMQSLRQSLHMLLWMDEWEPLDPQRCWSECIRRDFRAMTGERRVRWRALLKHLRGNAPVRMPAGWAREAKPLVEAVGLEDFRECARLWFAPFCSGEKLPLTVAGSHVLKGMVWYCAVTRDEELKECAMGLLSAQWRQKRNTEKAVAALAEFGISKDELRARGLIAPERNEMPRWMEKAIETVCQAPWLNIVEAEDGLIVVQGQLHFYRLYRATGRIERVSDGKELRLNWSAVPDQFRVTLRRECDSEQQVRLRAYMLLNDGAFGKYFEALG